MVVARGRQVKLINARKKILIHLRLRQVGTCRNWGRRLRVIVNACSLQISRDKKAKEDELVAQARRLSSGCNDALEKAHEPSVFAGVSQRRAGRQAEVCAGVWRAICKRGTGPGADADPGDGDA